jgi:hypothetical protein
MAGTRLSIGDDTKVRKLSGSRSYGDARAQQFELKRDFQGARRRQSTEKLCFAIAIRQPSGRFSPWSGPAVAIRGVFHSLNRREFTLNA